MSHDEPQGLGAFSGVLRHRDAAQGRSAFSGKGRTLGESEKLGDEKEPGVAHAQEEKNDKVGYGGWVGGWLGDLWCVKCIITAVAGLVKRTLVTAVGLNLPTKTD